MAASSPSNLMVAFTMDYSRIRSMFYAVMSVLVPVSLYIEKVGGLDNLNIWEMIIFFGSMTGAGVAGHHVPSRLEAVESSAGPRPDPAVKSADDIPLAAAIARLQKEPPTIIEKIARRSRGESARVG